MTPTALRERTRATPASRREDLIGLGHALHADPELASEEHRAARRITDLAEAAGSETERGAYGLPTAFGATAAGSGGLVIGICAEYDALPGIDHARGHNVNGAAAVAAALALAPHAADLGLTVKLLGTPAEESGGGKVDMLRAGAMTAHAAPQDAVGMTSQGVSSWKARYDGVAVHAAAMPERGTDAADALMIAQVAIAAYRQRMPPGGVVPSTR